MNFRRHSALLGCAAFGAATFLGTGTAYAEPTPTAIADEASDFGENAEGWHIIIRNESDTALSVFVPGTWSNVKVHERSGNLGIGGTAHVYGQRASFEGPANVDFEYRQRQGAFSDGVAFRVVSVRPSKNPVMIAVPSCSTLFSPKLKCSVARKELDKPIEFVVSNK